MILDAYDITKAQQDMKSSKLIVIDGKAFEVKKNPSGTKYIEIDKVKITQK